MNPVKRRIMQSSPVQVPFALNIVVGLVLLDVAFKDSLGGTQLLRKP